MRLTLASVRFACVFVLFACLAQAQSFHRNNLTFSGGQARQIGGSAFETSTAVTLGGTYGFRVLRNVELESGVFRALDPLPPACNRLGCFNADNRFTWVLFGGRSVLPLKNGRVELSLGGGALYEWFSVSNPNTAFGGTSYSGWGGYFAASGAVALDRGRHFWLAASPRWFLANPANLRDRWFVIGGDFGFHF
jgi:hypothetical protein